MPRENVRTRLPARAARPQSSSAAADGVGDIVEGVETREKSEIFGGGQFVVEQRAVADQADAVFGPEQQMLARGRIHWRPLDHS